MAADVTSGEQLHPDWSRDGLRIAFSAEDHDGTRDLWVANIDGTKASRVFDCVDPCVWSDDPSWAPDDATLAAGRTDKVNGGPDGIPTLILVDVATGAATTLATGQPIEGFYVPRWSGDGRRVIVEVDRFASARVDETVVDETTIGTVELDDKMPSFQPILPWRHNGPVTPDWRPVDDLIVYSVAAAEDTESADVHVVGVDGTGDRTLTAFASGGGWAIQPSWAPDGDRIIFVGEDIVRTKPNPATVSVDGTGLARMPWDGTSRTHPRLRPTP